MSWSDYMKTEGYRWYEWEEEAKKKILEDGHTNACAKYIFFGDCDCGRGAPNEGGQTK